MTYVLLYKYLLFINDVNDIHETIYLELPNQLNIQNLNDDSLSEFLVNFKYVVKKKFSMFKENKK